VTGTAESIASDLQRAFAARDLDLLGTLLADDARWGDDDASNKCRNRQQVVATFSRLLDEGVDGRVEEVRVSPNGVLCRLRVDWPDATGRAPSESLFHLYVVRDGLIAEIRRYDDLDSALAALGEPRAERIPRAADGDESNLADAFFSAIRRGDLQSLERLLREHPQMASAPLGGRYRTRTPLHVATDWPGYFPNGPQVVRLLIAAGADPNARETGNVAETPLHWAASSDDVDVAEALVDGGADIEMPDGSIGTPLDNAIGYACWHVARLLVARGARVDKPWHAAALGLLKRLEELLAEPAATRDEISKAFWHACSGSQRRTAELLLSRGADLNWVPDYAEGTPLDTANGLATRQENVISWLRELGARSTQAR
jgi:ketosteroid isomerase-like protein